MVPMKQAVDVSAAFAASILGPDRTTGLQLEEVELSKVVDRDVWQITLSMLRPSPFGNNVAVTNPYLPRDYKTFFVDRETGEVLSMKIRELAGVG
jgi:hypothetical protein